MSLGFRSLVARTRVSVMTLPGLTGAPKMRVATAATSWRCWATVPPEDIVADVPTHTSESCASQASRTRRTNMATSAPCRPR